MLRPTRRSRAPRPLARRRRATVLLGTSLALLPVVLPQRAEAFLVLRMKQTPLGIEVTGGGRYSTNGLTKVADAAVPDYYGTNPADLPGPEVQSAFSYLFVGGPASGPRQTWLWSGVSSAGADFGNNDVVWPGVVMEGNAGSAFGIDGGYALLLLPSGTACPGNAPCDIAESRTVFAEKSFGDLGISPGTYTWTWGGGGANQELRLEIESPVPGPLPALGAAAAFGWSRRLRRRACGERALQG